MTENQITVAMEKFRKQIPSTGEDSVLMAKMRKADEGCMDGLMNLSLKKKWVAFVLSFLLGGVGAGRFYLGDWKKAILRIIATVLTGVLSSVYILGIIVWAVSFIWLVAEWFLCFKVTKQKNYEILSSYLNSYLLSHPQVGE